MTNEADAPQVSWKAIETGARLVVSEGQELGRVEEVAGDQQADVFDGLVVTLGGQRAGRRDRRYVAAERVRGIWPDRVEVELAPDEIDGLPAYTEPRSVTWRAGHGGFTDRLRSAFKDLFGRRG